MQTRIARVELTRFSFDVEGLGLPSHGAAGVGNLIARKGSRLTLQRWAIRIETGDGARGEYVTHWVGTPSSFGQAAMLAPHLIGRDPAAREEIWQDLRREVRAYDHVGHGPIDIALWDLHARRLGTSVAAMLGAFRTRLPTYASTYHGQDAWSGRTCRMQFRPSMPEDTPTSLMPSAGMAACPCRTAPASRTIGISSKPTKSSTWCSRPIDGSTLVVA